MITWLLIHGSLARADATSISPVPYLCDFVLIVDNFLHPYRSSIHNSCTFSSSHLFPASYRMIIGNELDRHGNDV